MRTLALIAHDEKKADLLDWVGAHLPQLEGHTFYATGTTGGRILKQYPHLVLTLLKSGPLGGDQQVGALICEGKIDALVFFTDPLTPHPHDVDVKALTRLSTVYNIPMACNRATADLLITSPLFAG